MLLGKICSLPVPYYSTITHCKCAPRYQKRAKPQSIIVNPFYGLLMVMIWCGHTFSSGLHATGDVDRVSKETVPRHRDSNHSADHWTTVHAAAYHQPAVWTMSNLRASTNNGIPRARSTGIWDIVAYIYHSLQKCGSTKNL